MSVKYTPSEPDQVTNTPEGLTTARDSNEVPAAEMMDAVSGVAAVATVWLVNVVVLTIPLAGVCTTGTDEVATWLPDEKTHVVGVREVTPPVAV